MVAGAFITTAREMLRVSCCVHQPAPRHHHHHVHHDDDDHNDHSDNDDNSSCHHYWSRCHHDHDDDGDDDYYCRVLELPALSNVHMAYMLLATDMMDVII